MTKVLFVCLGNICRSTMAEALMRHISKDYDIIIDSCGTSGYNEGDIPHIGTRKILEKNSVSWDGIFSRKIRKNDFKEFDYIIAMDDSNVYDLLALNPNANIHKLSEFSKNIQFDDVPDPYYYNNFDEVFTMISDALEGLLETIIAEN